LESREKNFLQEQEEEEEEEGFNAACTTSN